MFYLYFLLALALLTVALFSAPLRAKVWTALVAVGVATIATIAPSIGVLMGASEIVIMQMQSPIFGIESLSIDSLSAFMLLIIGISGIATILYSRGYLEHYLKEKSSAHISLHYLALVVMIISMMLVVISSGGFSFLLAWEMMTIASFILILFDAQRAEAYTLHRGDGHIGKIGAGGSIAHTAQLAAAALMAQHIVGHPVVVQPLVLAVALFQNGTAFAKHQ